MAASGKSQINPGIVLLVALVRLLPQPWRGIVDAGVVIGLTWGAVSLVVCCLRVWAAPECASAPEVVTDVAGASSVRS